MIYSDSTALPRPPEVEPSETWYSLLGKDFKSIYLRGDGGITSSQIKDLVAKDATYFGLGKTKNLVVILAFGIVDFAPRPFTYRLAVVKKIPWLGKYLWAILSRLLLPHRAKIQRISSYQITEPLTFKKDLSWIVEKIQSNHRVLILTTPIPSSHACRRSPGLENSIRNLNAIKERLAKHYESVKLVSLDCILDSDYVTPQDGHHFSKAGHRKVADIIRDTIVLLDNKYS